MKKSLITLSLMALCLSWLHAETREWTNSDGVKITAELLRVEGESVVLKVTGREYNVELASLSEADREYVAAQQALMEEAKAEAEAARPEILKKLEGELVLMDGRDLEPYAFEDESKIEYLAFYSSASWCGPCQAFSPTLSREYKSLKRRHDNFELILLTADRDEESWKGYMQDHRMAYPSLAWGSGAKGTAGRGRNTNGIPSIHIIRVSDGAVLEDGSSGASKSLEKLEDILKNSDS